MPMGSFVKFGDFFVFLGIFLYYLGGGGVVF
jgi:hypothetical protein